MSIWLPPIHVHYHGLDKMKLKCHIYNKKDSQYLPVSEYLYMLQLVCVKQHKVSWTISDHFHVVNQCLRGSSLHASKNIHNISVVYVCVGVCLSVCLCVCQEVDCCGGGDRGCRAPNEGVRNKISALGSSSAPRLPQTPSDWKWNSCDDLIYMLITNGPPENRPINAFLLPPVSPTTQGNEWERERVWVRGEWKRGVQGEKRRL